MKDHVDEAKPPTGGAWGLLRFLAFLPVYIAGVLLAYPLVPLAVFLSDPDGRLPRLLRWLETHDAPGWIGPATEEATMRTTRRWGLRAGLVHYLWRNKAYTLRHWMRARVSRDMPTFQTGSPIPARWGFSHWLGRVGPYFEWQPRIGLGKVHLYLRAGWKLKPIFDAGRWPVGETSIGMFTGISPRMDDWDDYPVEAPQARGPLLRLPWWASPPWLIPAGIFGALLWGLFLRWILGGE